MDIQESLREVIEKALPVSNYGFKTRQVIEDLYSYVLQQCPYLNYKKEIHNLKQALRSLEWRNLNKPIHLPFVRYGSSTMIIITLKPYKKQLYVVTKDNEMILFKSMDTIDELLEPAIYEELLRQLDK